MLRKKILGDMPHPNYSICNYWYTLKLRHGGVTIDQDDGSFEYYGGSVSTFDFVDCRNWGKQYLVNLCEELGYVGDRTKFLFGLDSNGRLKPIESEHDVMMLVIRAQFSKELYVALEAEKDTLVSEEETVEGEAEYVDENVVVDAASDAVVDRLQRKYFLTYIDINSDGNSIVGSDDVVSDSLKVLRSKSADARKITPKRVRSQRQSKRRRVSIFCPGKPVDVNKDYVDEELREHDEMKDHVDSEKAKHVEIDKGKCKMVEYDDLDSDDDSEYSVDIDSCEELIDDIMYRENVVVDEDVDKIDDINGESGDAESSDTSYDTDGDESMESVESEGEEDGECSKDVRVKGKLQLGSIFSTRQQFKDAVTEFSVQEGRPTQFTKNDLRRVYAKCRKRDDKPVGCGWHINALKVKDEQSYQIREIDMSHTCARVFNVDNVKSGWLARKFENEFRCDPKRSVKGFRTSVIKELACNISHQQAIRARQKALKRIEGSAQDQYSKLWDYAETLRAKNPGSTVVLQLENQLFKRLYVCFKAIKRGFTSGCRPWIGVDGCHLSGLNRGVLLSAVCMDPNNDPYPLAYALVSVENKDSWEWFLQLLKDDLLTEREDIYTFMSDKQKGLIGAFESVLPGVENRFCVRHLHGNMKRAGFRGDNFKDLLWDAARATTIPAFNKVMEAIKAIDVKCFEWLQGKPAREWSRSHFTTHGKCDSLVNNMCEQFNNAILDARDKPILTLLDWIRQYMMGRLQRYRDRAENKWGNMLICPRIAKLLEGNQKGTRDCVPLKSNEFLYEISSIRNGSRYVVDLQNYTCDCRGWDVSGIPCCHAISAINAEGKDPTHFLSSCYFVSTYMEVYIHAMIPIADEDLWTKTGCIPPLPPAFLKKKKFGRPPKKRRLSANESPTKKMKRKGVQKLSRQHASKKNKGKDSADQHSTRGLIDEPLEHPQDHQEQPWTEEADGICDLTLPDVIETTTQHEELKDTQPEEIHQKIPMRPTTRKGRKALAAKKVDAVAANRLSFKPPKQMSPAKRKVFDILKTKFWPSAVQVAKPTVQLTEPPSINFHPGQSSSIAKVAEKGKEHERLRVFTAEGGKKFTNLSSLRAATRKKRGDES